MEKLAAAKIRRFSSNIWGCGISQNKYDEGLKDLIAEKKSK